MSEPLQLVPSRSDKDAAAEHKAKITEVLVALCKAMDDAKADGFVTSSSLGQDWAGKTAIATLILAKHY